MKKYAFCDVVEKQTTLVVVGFDSEDLNIDDDKDRAHIEEFACDVFRDKRSEFEFHDVEIDADLGAVKDEVRDTVVEYMPKRHDWLQKRMRRVLEGYEHAHAREYPAPPVPDVSAAGVVVLKMRVGDLSFTVDGTEFRVARFLDDHGNLQVDEDAEDDSIEDTKRRLLRDFHKALWPTWDRDETWRRFQVVFGWVKP